MAALTVSTTLLPDAFIGVAYEASFAVSGTVAAHALTISAGTTQTGKDALPSGLSYTTDGRIDGTPDKTNVPGTYNLSVKVTDGTNTTDDIALSLRLFDASQYPQHDTEHPDDPDTNLHVEWPTVQ